MGISIAAMLVALVAVSPPGQAASQTVRAALFASEAGTVNGLRVSRTPKANHLLALDRDGRYPRSVIPATVGTSGPRGPAGERGVRGADGLPGGDTVFARTNATTAISRFQANVATIAHLDDLPPGSWLVMALTGAGGVGSAVPMTCAITSAGRIVSRSRATIGRGHGGARVAGLAAFAAWESHGLSRLAYDCALDSESTGEGTVAGRFFGAIRVGSLEVRRQGP